MSPLTPRFLVKFVLSDTVRTIVAVVPCLAILALIVPLLRPLLGTPTEPTVAQYVHGFVRSVFGLPPDATTAELVVGAAGWAAALMAFSLALHASVAFVTLRRNRHADTAMLMPSQTVSLRAALPAEEVLALCERGLAFEPGCVAVRVVRERNQLTAKMLDFRSSLRGMIARRMRLGKPARTTAPRLVALAELWTRLPLPRFWTALVTISLTSLNADATEVVVRSRWHRLLPALDTVGSNARNVREIVERLEEQFRARVEERRAGAERAALEKRLLEARLQALQAQVEPHFLYNTLANVQYLVRHDASAADAMIGHLIDYLRAALPRMRDGGSTVGRELELARAYLEVLQIRMGARLRYTIDAPGDLANHPFPPMMLMSLVENAVRHGVEPKPGGGHVHIGVAADEAQVRIGVRDDGAGLGASHGTGVGLRNVHERLTALFGERASVSVEPRAEGGVIAMLAIPRAAADVAAS